MVALLFTSYSAMQFFCAPLWGRLSDRVGRRPILLMSTGGNAIALTVFALAQSYWWLLGARVVSGLFTANIAVANAYVADVTRPEDRTQGMGLVSAAFGIGFVVGPAIGGELSAFGYAAPAFAAASLAGVNLLLALLLLPESLPPSRRAVAAVHGVGFRGRLASAGSVPGLRAILALVFLHVFAFSRLEVALVLFANRRLGFDVRQCGHLFAFVGVVMVAVQALALGSLSRRFGERRVVYVGLALVALGMSMVPTTPASGGRSYLWLVAFMTCVALGQSLANPSLRSLLSRRAPAQRQGVALGLTQSVSALARVVGPPLAGLLLDWGDESTPFIVGGALMAATCLYARASLPRR
jgi:multidrug resistance protein